MKIINFLVGKEPSVIEIDGDLKSMQATVGGYIQAVYINHPFVIVCDEEGLLKQKWHNRTIPIRGQTFGIPIHGDFFICKIDIENEFTGIDLEITATADEIRKYLKENDVYFTALTESYAAKVEKEMKK